MCKKRKVVRMSWMFFAIFQLLHYLHIPFFCAFAFSCVYLMTYAMFQCANLRKKKPKENKQKTDTQMLNIINVDNLISVGIRTIFKINCVNIHHIDVLQVMLNNNNNDSSHIPIHLSLVFPVLFFTYYFYLVQI